MKKNLFFLCLIILLLAAIFVFSSKTQAQYQSRVALWLVIPPRCQILLPNETYPGNWFDINLFNSSAFAFKSLSLVNFSSDNNLNGSPDDPWRGPFNWRENYDDPASEPSPDWDALNKTMKWSFSATGTYEIWAKLTDNFGYQSQCYRLINVAPPPNEPPHASISCDPSECGTTNCNAYTGCPFHLINNSTDPDGQSDIVKSEWDILNWGADPDLSCSGICNFTPQTAILTPGTYNVELLVQDKAGASDTETINFYLLREAMAGFMCSLDNENWQACEAISPNIGQLVYFKDDPSLPEHSSPSQGATSITKRVWKLNENIFNSDNNPNPSTNLNQTSNIIELIITDDQSRTDSVSHTISTTLPLPEWKEIPPFLWIKKFLASIVSFFSEF